MFADWLEENGYDDEAVVQRSWTPERQQAEDWLGEFAEECEISYPELIQAANDFLDKGEDYCLGVDLPDIAYTGWEEFWVRFTTVTGRSVAEEKRDSFLRCAC